MTTVKRLFISLLVLLGCSAGAWAIEQDTDGYYLIGSVQDWKDFAELVNNGTNTAANARMTADIDLGDDQTMVGDGYYFVDNNQRPFKGIFDGQGHALTIHYVTAEVVKKYSAAGIAEPQYLGCAPFGYVWGGTIRNLRTAGTITATHEGVAGIVAYTYNNPLIENCRSSVDITFTDNHRGAGGITYFNYGNQLTINNCLFDGTITGGSNATGSAGFVVYRYENATGDIYIKNSLMAGTFVNLGPNDCCTFVRYSDHAQITNSYYTTALGTVQGTQATAEQLADGTIAYKLQANREDLVWGQRIGIDPEPVLTNDESYRVYKCINGGYTNDPDLAYPGLQQDADGNYLIGSVLDWQEFAELVNSGTNTAANAKMVADVDLGDDQTMVGTYHQKYQGTYDGQGHTLTFKYNTAGMSFEPEQRDLSLNFLGAAPFRDIEGATICNLHTAGSVTAEKIGASGLVGWTYGTNTIENCWSDVNIVSSNNTADTFAGFVAFQYGTQLNITDCVYTGKIQSASNISHAGFVAFQRYGKSSLNNCLLLLDEGSDVNTTTTQGLKYYTFVRNFESHNVANTINNCYYLTPFGVAQGTQTTDDDISDGTITTALQADRSEEIWVQDPELGIPMLKLFANNITYKVPSSGIGTFSAKGQVLLPDGLTAYYCKTYNKENAAISVFGIDSNIVPAATGVLLEGEPGATFTLTGACGEAPTITDNELVAVPESTHINATDGAYTNFMMSGGKFIRIADESEDVKMPANRAYLPLLTDAVGNAKSVTLLWRATGIESLTPSTSPKDEGNIYNLNGQKLSSPLKGINIINGRKVIVK